MDPVSLSAYNSDKDCSLLATFVSNEESKVSLWIRPIEIGLEEAPFVVFVYFISSFEHVKSLLIMGPNNTKNSSKRVIFS